MLIASTEYTLASINIATDLMTSGFLWLLLLGSFGGLLAGLLGVGGGMLFIPVITSYLHQYDISSAEMVKFTLANSIALVFMSGVSGTFRQIKTELFFLQFSIAPKNAGLVKKLPSLIELFINC